MTGLVKICGLSTPATLEAALSGGADMVGFVRFPRSPRHVSLETGRELSRAADGRALRVLLTVDPDDCELDAAVAAIDPDLIQLHCHETPDRVAAIRHRVGRPAMKAIGVSKAGDLAAVTRYRGTADRILLDAKPPRGADRPGGNGIAIDWTLLSALDPTLDIVLSGGLDAGNVADAIATTGIAAVDVSSGVETRPGEKDPAKIHEFIRAARAAFATARRVA